MNDTKVKANNQRQPAENHVDNDESNALKSISPFRIMLAALIGVSVVIYMFIKDFDLEQFKQIELNGFVLSWIAIAFGFMVFRHFCYMIRLRIITDKFFSWRKAFELIMMWEFSSAVTPTSVGGAAVAMFAIAQEKLSAGKTAMIVLYTVVIDTFSFLSALFVFFLIFGPLMIQPGSTSFEHLWNESEWGTAFITAYTIMLIYGGTFFYGVVINAKGLQKGLLLLCKLPFLNRFKEKAINITQDMELASKELRQKKWTFHVGTYATTMIAWGSRFMVLNCLIFAFIANSNNPEISAYYHNFMDGQTNIGGLWEQIFIYARQQAMYVIMAVMPSPGGAGVAEYAFKTFHNDYIPTTESNIAAAGTLMVIMAFIWRFFTYYSYLLLGAIFVPNWIKNIVERNRLEAQKDK